MQNNKSGTSLVEEAGERHKDYLFPIRPSTAIPMLPLVEKAQSENNSGLFP